MKKRIFSITLTVILLAGLFPTIPASVVDSGAGASVFRDASGNILTPALVSEQLAAARPGSGYGSNSRYFAPVDSAERLSADLMPRYGPDGELLSPVDGVVGLPADLASRYGPDGEFLALANGAVGLPTGLTPRYGPGDELLAPVDGVVGLQADLMPRYSPDGDFLAPVDGVVGLPAELMSQDSPGGEFLAATDGVVGLLADLTPQYGSNGKFLTPIEPPVAGSIPISTRAQLELIGNHADYPLSGSYHLTADIDLSGAEWVSIGDFSRSIIGTFNGQGFGILSLTIMGDKK